MCSKGPKINGEKRWRPAFDPFFILKTSTIQRFYEKKKKTSSGLIFMVGTGRAPSCRKNSHRKNDPKDVFFLCTGVFCSVKVVFPTFLFSMLVEAKLKCRKKMTPFTGNCIQIVKF